MIEIQGLNKVYDKRPVVKNLDLVIEKGELFAFLGPNGAGKSTTINMIATAITPTSGTIFVGDYQVGKDNLAIRREIGIVFQENVLDDLLTVAENLHFWGKSYSLDKEEMEKQLVFLKDLLNLEEILNRPFGKLSGGQKRRAEIARAILHRPSLLILDEPTTGLDPETRVHVWKTITYLRQELEMTVFLTTHYMEEAAEADHLAIFKAGELKILGTPNEIKNQYAKDSLKLYNSQLNRLRLACEEKGLAYQQGTDFLKLEVADSLIALNILNQLAGCYQSFELHKGNLDDVFLEVVKGEE